MTDAHILLSYINTKLRDGASLEEACGDLDLSEEEIAARLAEIGYAFVSESNRFVPISP